MFICVQKTDAQISTEVGLSVSNKCIVVSGLHVHSHDYQGLRGVTFHAY